MKHTIPTSDYNLWSIFRCTQWVQGTINITKHCRKISGASTKTWARGRNRHRKSHLLLNFIIERVSAKPCLVTSCCCFQLSRKTSCIFFYWIPLCFQEMFSKKSSIFQRHLLEIFCCTRNKPFVSLNIRWHCWKCLCLFPLTCFGRC